MDALTKATEVAGGVGALAKAIGVTQGAVSNWRARGGEVPALHCYPIEQATDRAVMRWDLRPDDWHRIWPELIGAEGAPPVATEAEQQGAA